MWKQYLLASHTPILEEKEKNVEHEITDIFKVYTEIPELFRNLLNLLPDKKFLKDRYITPENFIERKNVDEKEIYRFRKFQEVATIVDNKYFTYFEYISVQHCLTPTLIKCKNLKPLTSPNFHLTPLLEYLAFHPDSKVSSESRKLFTQKPIFDINN